jgi:hypothetical protein
MHDTPYSRSDGTATTIIYAIGGGIIGAVGTRLAPYLKKNRFFIALDVDDSNITRADFTATSTWNGLPPRIPTTLRIVNQSALSLHPISRLLIKTLNPISPTKLGQQVIVNRRSNENAADATDTAAPPGVWNQNYVRK